MRHYPKHLAHVMIALCLGAIVTLTPAMAAETKEGDTAMEVPTVQPKGEILYNGIVLPEVWPPAHLDPASDDPMPVPYLSNPPKIIPIDVGRQLFVDDFLIAKTDMERVFHKPEMHPGNPIFTPIKEEGDLVAMLSAGAYWNSAKEHFEIFYISGRFTKNNRSLHLATSTDMMNWKRTDLGNGSGNCIFKPGHASHPGAEGTSVLILDPAAKDSAERYKLMAMVSRFGRKTHVLSTSPDLVQWSDPIPAGPGGDTSNAFYNPFRGKWIFSIKTRHTTGVHARKSVERWGMGLRSRQYIEQDSFTEGSDWSDRVFWVGADRLDIPEPPNGYPDYPEQGEHCQLYNLHAMPYESLMIGVFNIHRGPENDLCEGFPKLTDINVGFSRDGFHWDRPDRSSFINSSRKEGTWNKAYTRGADGICLVVGEKLIFPFTAFSGTDPFNKTKGIYNGG